MSLRAWPALGFSPIIEVVSTMVSERGSGWHIPCLKDFQLAEHSLTLSSTYGPTPYVDVGRTLRNKLPT